MAETARAVKCSIIQGAPREARRASIPPSAAISSRSPAQTQMKTSRVEHFPPGSSSVTPSHPKGRGVEPSNGTLSTRDVTSSTEGHLRARGTTTTHCALSSSGLGRNTPERRQAREKAPASGQDLDRDRRSVGCFQKEAAASGFDPCAASGVTPPTNQPGNQAPCCTLVQR